MQSEIREQDLVAELDDIHSFVQCIVDAVDKKNHSTLIITPLLYSRHIAVLYLVIEWMRREVKDEAAKTGQLKPHLRLEKWCSENGVW